MSLKEKRCFQLSPLVTDREDLCTEFSGLTIPSTEERYKEDSWEEQQRVIYEETNCTTPRRVSVGKIEGNENKLLHVTGRPSKEENRSLLPGHPDSPRPPGTTLFNDNNFFATKKRLCKSTFPTWASQRRKQSSVHSPKRNSESVERNCKQRPSLRARLINRFILSTRRAVHEYAAAATAVISPSGDFVDSTSFQSFHRCSEEGAESSDVTHRGIQGGYCRICKEQNTHSPNLSFDKESKNSSGLESRVRSKSFPEYSVEHNNTIHEEYMSRMRSCSQVLEDEIYGTKSDNWMHVSDKSPNSFVARGNNDITYVGERQDFSPISPSIQDIAHFEEQVDNMETSSVQDEKDSREKEGNLQTAKYKKKMNLKLDLDSVQDPRGGGGGGGGSRIIPVKTNKKKSSFATF